MLYIVIENSPPSFTAGVWIKLMLFFLGTWNDELPTILLKIINDQPSHNKLVICHIDITNPWFGFSHILLLTLI